MSVKLIDKLKTLYVWPPAPSFMSQHYLKYHFKSFIQTTNYKATDDVNGNTNNETETDLMNGNSKAMKTSFNATGIGSTGGIIRITENPLPENVANC